MNIHWRAFGDSLPTLKTSEGIQAVIDKGVNISPDESKEKLRHTGILLEHSIVQMLEVITPVVASFGPEILQNLGEICEDTSLLVLDLLSNKSEVMHPFEHFPKEELYSFIRLCLESRIYGHSLPMIAPVCPDYKLRYQLADGYSLTAMRLFAAVPEVMQLFKARNFKPSIQVHMADVEAFDTSLLEATGETSSTFLAKVTRSANLLNELFERMGLSSELEVTSMLRFMGEGGIDYFATQHDFADQIHSRSDKKVSNVIKSLILERYKNLDTDQMNQMEAQNLVIHELAGYSVYGNACGSRAIILSPDAVSAIPAYNFFKQRGCFSPVIQIKSKKITAEKQHNDGTNNMREYTPMETQSL